MTSDDDNDRTRAIRYFGGLGEVVAVVIVNIIANAMAVGANHEL